MGKKLDFKSKRKYNKWLAYNWIHNKREMGKAPHKEISIRGKKHKVDHKRKR